MTAFRTSPCSYCGREIVWGASADGAKKQPLDPRAPVFRVTLRQDGTLLAEVVRESPGRGAFMVSHFATCPKLPKRGGQ